MNQYKRVYFDRCEQTENATLSKIWSPDEDLELFGLERRWLGNRSNASCFPPGAYALMPWVSPTYGDVWAFCGGSVTPFREDTPDGDVGRWGCLMHGANYWDQLQGCVAPGMNRGEKDGDVCVWSSKNALKLFEETMGRQPLVAYVRSVLRVGG